VKKAGEPLLCTVFIPTTKVCDISAKM